MDPGRPGTPGDDEPGRQDRRGDVRPAADPGRRRPRPHPGGVPADPGDDDLRAAVADRPRRTATTSPTASSARWPIWSSEALDHEAPLSLPTSEHPIVAAAMAYTKEHLDSVTADEVSRAVSVSERTLATPVPGHARAVVADVPSARPDAAGDGAAGRARPVGAGDVDGRRLREPQLVHPCLHPVLRRDAVVIPATGQRSGDLIIGTAPR